MLHLAGAPLHDSSSSVPSGHTNFAFVAATHLARSIADSTDEWYGNLGYLFWLPAAYVGINRVEANRHFPTDVAFGAFLRVTLTNIIYDVHYGDEHRTGIFDSRRRGWHVEPDLAPGGMGAVLSYRFQPGRADRARGGSTFRHLTEQGRRPAAQRTVLDGARASRPET